MRILNNIDAEPTAEELAAIEKSMEDYMNDWDIVKCPRCRQTFSLQACGGIEGYVVCPHCGAAVE